MTLISGIIAGGGYRYRNTRTYKKKVAEIRYQVEIKYQSLIENETNYFRKLGLKLKRNLEIRRETLKLNSPRNLFGNDKL